MYIDIFMYNNMYVYSERNAHSIKYLKTKKKKKHSRQDLERNIYMYKSSMYIYIYINMYIYLYIYIYILQTLRATDPQTFRPH